MKIFIDTNIFLDFLLKREYYEDAMIIFNAVEKIFLTVLFWILHS